MQNDKLLPCPFCGEKAETTFICDGKYNQIKCKTPKCIMNVDMSAFYKSKEEAIEQWNTRKPMERIVEQLEDEKPCRYKLKGYIEKHRVLEIVRNGGKE